MKGNGRVRKVTYVQVDSSQYDAKLLSALAGGTGPDIFEIGDHSLGRWKSLLAPLPTSTFAATFNVGMMATYFPGVVADDFVSDGNLYALPVSVDTLAMIYNRDYFDSAGIALPPKTWDDLKPMSQRLARDFTDRSDHARGSRSWRDEGEHGECRGHPLPFEASKRLFPDDVGRPDIRAVCERSGRRRRKFLPSKFSNASSPYYTWNDAMGDALQVLFRATPRSSLTMSVRSRRSNKNRRS